MHYKIEIFINIITAISVLFIVVQYLFSLTNVQLSIVYVFDFLVVIILAVDFSNRAIKSKQGLKYVLRHWYELPAMIPLFTFSIIEGWENSIVAILRLIRLIRLIQLFFRSLRALQGKNKFAYVILFSFSSISIGAVLGYLFESPNPDSNINNIGDAFWWAIATVTTVGYGDVYPVTAEGRILGSLLMIVGIAILWVFISTVGIALRDHKIENMEKMTLEDETKTIIKLKIDKIEQLEKGELDLLMSMISNLHQNMQKEKDTNG
ncbi:MAG: potassium channel family protein [Nitrosopumilus sp.]|nr:potassium channel family protein [Nitrosopumilus sp.]